MATKIIHDSGDSITFAGATPALPEDMVAVTQQQIDALKSPTKKAAAQIALDARRPIGEIVTIMVGPELDAGTQRARWSAAIDALPIDAAGKSACHDMLDKGAWDFLYQTFNDYETTPPLPFAG